MSSTFRPAFQIPSVPTEPLANARAIPRLVMVTNPYLTVLRARNGHSEASDERKSVIRRRRKICVMRAGKRPKKGERKKVRLGWANVAMSRKERTNICGRQLWRDAALKVTMTV